MGFFSSHRSPKVVAARKKHISKKHVHFTDTDVQRHEYDFDWELEPEYWFTRVELKFFNEVRYDDADVLRKERSIRTASRNDADDLTTSKRNVFIGDKITNALDDVDDSHEISLRGIEHFVFPVLQKEMVRRKKELKKAVIGYSRNPAARRADPQGIKLAEESAAHSTWARDVATERAQEVALTQTAKKTRDHKASVIQDIRDAIDKHATLYLFSYENMRSHKFKKIRMDFRKTDVNGNSSRIFLGKNKLMQIALGRTLEDEYAENLKSVSTKVSGSVGLILTNRSHDDVETYFANLIEEDFARAGAVSPRKVVLTREMVSNFPPNMVEQFRKLGLPVDVNNGKLEFVGGKGEHTICKSGSVLTAENCKILCQFGIMLAEFKVKLVCRWDSSDGSFEDLL